ncbi:MAG: hypothetical protein PHE55_13775 [Methylococcaceae bacterium]|nr:hypothetical protein [Methylococcaceae bacterium]
MKIQKLATVLGVSLLLGACATPHKDVMSLDAKIADISKSDFDQFIYHQSIAEENLEHVLKVRQYWQDDHYWNIDMEKGAHDSAAKAAEHSKLAEGALTRWWDANYMRKHRADPHIHHHEHHPDHSVAHHHRHHKHHHRHHHYCPKN